MEATALLRVGSWKRAAIMAAAVLLALAFATAEALLAQERTVLSIDQAVRIALRQNRDVQTGRLALEEAEGRVKEAWSNVYPSFDFNASYQRNLSPTITFLPLSIVDPDAEEGEFFPAKFGADNQWNSTISMEQPIFEAAAFIGVGAAGRYKSLQEEMLRGLSQGVVTRVRMAYYQLLLQQEQLRLIENSVARVRESLQETQALNRAGLASDYDVLRLEVELANLEPNLRRAENAVHQGQRQLSLELDLPHEQAVAVEGSLAEMDVFSLEGNTAANRNVITFASFWDESTEAVERAISMAEDLRSDLKQLQLTESLRKTEMRLEQVEYFPRITLFGNYIINAQADGDPKFFGGKDAYRAYGRNIGVRVSLPIFQGFRRDARIDQKRSALRQAETRTRLGEDQARLEVQNLLEQTEEALLRARGQNRAVAQAQRGFEIASAQYREGLSSQLELTDAEVALRQSEFNYAQAVYDFLVARAQLDQATGRVPMVDFEPAVTDGVED